MNNVTNQRRGEKSKRSVPDFVFRFLESVHVTILWAVVFRVCDNGKVLLLDSSESSGRLREELQFFHFTIN